MPDKTNAPVSRDDARETPSADPRAEDTAVPRDDSEEVPAPDDLDIEAPEADVAEQRVPVLEDEEEDEALVWAPVPDDVDPADRTEQQRVVAHDDDEYR